MLGFFFFQKNCPPLTFFFKINIFKKLFQVSNILDPDQAGLFIWPGLGPISGLDWVQSVCKDYQQKTIGILIIELKERKIIWQKSVLIREK